MQANRGRTIWSVIIILVVAFAVYVVAATPTFTLGGLDVNWTRREGLDLRGGLKVLLEADLPAGQTIDASSIDTAKQIVQNRINGLGVSEALVYKTQDNRRVVVEIPGATDSQQAVNTLKQTGLLEFVYLQAPLAKDTLVSTDCHSPSKVDCGGNVTGTVPGLSPSLTASGTVTPTTQANGLPFDAVMTGAAIKAAVVTVQSGQYVVDFEMTDEGARLFADFTSLHVGEYLAIVLDKRVVSSPRINSAITGGRGVIEGAFTADDANALAIQLRYGSLPVPLRVAQSSEVGPTLGQDSINKSLVAGVIGITTVIVFMLLYYRLPGVVASVALLIYALVTLALFQMIPVVLTLPGIAGFVLSVGVAVDANILIFERMKEELRGGRTLKQAVEAGFNRAWPSIRDSNISTLITCAVLFVFGSTFGASIVQGFAFTLAIGVAVSLFTAILVTRTIMHLMLDGVDLSERKSWFGI
jgi:preprotein translocase subunit SecD